MLQKLVLVFFMVCGLMSNAQDFSANWNAYFSYNSIIALTQGNGKIYAAAQNSVFTYDILTDEITTISTVQGLSGGVITAIHYSETYDILTIAYEDGIFDVVREGEEVQTIIDIENKPTIPPDEKRINHMQEYNGILYLATDFGISLYNLERLEFDDSYFIGDNGSRLLINQTAIQGDYIYASSLTGGIRRALVANDNLIDYTNWETIASGSWLGVASLQEQLYAISAGNTLNSFDGFGFNTVATYASQPLDLRVSEEFITVTIQDAVYIYNANGVLINTVGQLPEFLDQYNVAFANTEGIYIGTAKSGLLLGSSTTTKDFLQILPDGPLRNDPFNIEALPNQLWVVFGDYSDSYNPFPLKKRGISHLREEGWVNIPFEETLEANNLVNIIVNPENQEQVFISSYNSGLLEVVEDVPVQIFDETNSGLSDIPVSPTDVRINGTAYDNQSNLWMTNSFVENALARKSGDQIQGISVAEVIPDFDRVDGYTELVTDQQGNVYFGSNNRGLIGYNPNLDQFARLDGEEDGANLPTDHIQSLAIDNNGTLWIGTTGGLRVLFGPAQMFENPEIETQPIVILEDDIPVALLNDQVIQTIEVDGSNNKWIGTVSNGTFYFSPNGQETLLQFNTTNSPLPSNNVQDISIDSETGEVYFATPQGLVSYLGSAVAPAQDLEAVRAFPNPVRPTYTGMVTIDGLTAQANVKITDITGNLVYEEVSEGGSIQWDTTAFGRHKVASGVYLILVTSEDATETKIAKVMIIR